LVQQLANDPKFESTGCWHWLNTAFYRAQCTSKDSAHLNFTRIFGQIKKKFQD
jgi:hypothetical protein